MAVHGSDVMLDRPALIEADGRTQSHAELDAEANRIAHGLRAHGLEPSDTVAILSPNGFEYLAIYLAAMRSGLYCVPINWRLSGREICGILDASEAKVLFVHGSVEAAVPAEVDVRPHLRVRVVIGEHPSWHDFRRGIDDTPLACEVQGRLLGFTSATTGVAKGVYRKLEARRAQRRQARVTHGFELPTPGVHLCCSQFYHPPVLNLVGSEIAEGNTVVLPKHWDPEVALTLVERHRVTTTFMVPAMFSGLLKLPPDVRRKYDVSSLKFVLHSGAPCAIAVKREMIQWLGPVLWERYGSVEGPVSLVDSGEWLRHPGTVGRPCDGVQVKVLDESGEECARGEVGAIYIRPREDQAFEYKDDPAKTLASRRGEYYTVGDVGYMNDDGYLFLCDRQLDIIISGGVNIYAAEIEQVFSQHPQVADCAVIGAPHPLLGEAPRAFVQLMEGVEATQALIGELIDFSKSRLAVFKLPHRIEFVSTLPRDPNGKLYKRLIREALR